MVRGGEVKRHGRSSRRRRETEDYRRTGCKQTVAGRMTQRIRCQSRCFDCGGGSDRRLLGRVFSHQQMAMEPPNVTMTVFKKRKEKQTSLRKILGKQFGRSRPRRLPPTLADLMRRAKPLKKASHLPPPPPLTPRHQPSPLDVSFAALRAPPPVSGIKMRIR